MSRCVLGVDWTAPTAALSLYTQVVLGHGPSLPDCADITHVPTVPACLPNSQHSIHGLLHFNGLPLVCNIFYDLTFLYDHFCLENYEDNNKAADIEM